MARFLKVSRVFNASDGGAEVSGGGSSGLVEVAAASGVVTTPRSSIYIPFPVTHVAPFEIDILDIELSTLDILAGAFTFDGETFEADTVNGDTYAIGDSTGSTHFDAVLDVLDGPIQSPSLVSVTIRLLVNPGGSSRLPSFVSTATSWGQGGMNIGFNSEGFSLLATVPTTPARAAGLLIFPYGNGDPNTLSSGETITNGSWITRAKVAA